MKQTNKTNCRALRRGVAALLLFTVSVAANAYDFEVDRIYYNILSSSDKTCEVTSKDIYNTSTYSGNVVVPQTVKYGETTYSVTSIGKYAFYGCSNLTSVTIGESVTTIDSWAFRYCTGLTSVTIPNSVTTIGTYAFHGCSNLASVTIGESVTEIGNLAFYDCTGLTEVTIGNSVTTIGTYAFQGCTGLTSVTIPNSVTTIGDYAFHGCTGLTSVTIGNSVTTIRSYAFYGCTGLTSVTIPNSVTTIGDDAFQGCTGLTSVTIGNSVTTIRSYAFQGCTGLTSVSIPNSVTTIGYGAFGGCTGLTEITIPNSVTTIGDGAFCGCTGLTQFEVTEGSEYFCAVDGVLYSKDMTKLVAFPLASPLLPSFDIPNSVTEIGGFAFGVCTGLTSVTIPNSVTTIGSYAFEYCTGLTSIYSLNPEPPTCGSMVFWGDVDKRACTLYVPEGTKEAYSTADQWQDFLNIVDNLPNGVEGVAADGNAEAVGYYTTDGKQIPSLQRGINIVRYSDGTARKVLVK